jgi:hypothetical protein
MLASTMMSLSTRMWQPTVTWHPQQRLMVVRDDFVATTRQADIQIRYYNCPLGTTPNDELWVAWAQFIEAVVNLAFANADGARFLASVQGVCVCVETPHYQTSKNSTHHVS